MTRPPIPEPVKRACIYINAMANGGTLICDETKMAITVPDLLNARVHFDHNPPLRLRARVQPPGTDLCLPDDRDPASYKPHANNPAFIDVVSAAGHSIRTNKKRGLYPSDASRIAKLRRKEKPKKPSQLARKYAWAKKIKAERARSEP